MTEFILVGAALSVIFVIVGAFILYLADRKNNSKEE